VKICPVKESLKPKLLNTKRESCLVDGQKLALACNWASCGNSASLSATGK